MGARGKDEVLPQPDESILLGGTVKFVWLFALIDHGKSKITVKNRNTELKVILQYLS